MGLHCDCAAGCTQWGHSGVVLCVVVTVFKHIVKAKSSDFAENYQTVFKFYHHHHHHRDSCIQVLDCLNSIR